MQGNGCEDHKMPQCRMSGCEQAVKHHSSREQLGKVDDQWRTDHMRKPHGCVHQSIGGDDNQPQCHEQVGSLHLPHRQQGEAKCVELQLDAERPVTRLDVRNLEPRLQHGQIPDELSRRGDFGRRCPRDQYARRKQHSEPIDGIQTGDTGKDEIDRSLATLQGHQDDETADDEKQVWPVRAPFENLFCGNVSEHIKFARIVADYNG